MRTRTTGARALRGEPADPQAEFRQSVLGGLSASPKTLECKYFYDERGSALFDEICRQPEYYPTRVETSILETHAGAIAARVGPGAELVELGSGASLKTRILLRALAQPSRYLPVDISAEFLHESAARLAGEFPAVAVRPVIADFTAPFRLPGRAPGVPRLLFFPGSTVGNFHPAEAERFLRQTCRALAASSLVIGVDLRKDPRVLDAAYNDAAGVTAAFNLNLLHRINRELGADFDVEGFGHRAAYSQLRGRVEMHLVSRRAQAVEIAGRRFGFVAGESIHTENSYKYSAAGFLALAARAGWSPLGDWRDPDSLFAVFLLKPA